MPINIYTQYTKPEGSIKFDDLVAEAKKLGIDALALTDHGNFSGIEEFYNAALTAGIKPIIGIDVFCKLENEHFIRSIFYIKNETGYRSILDLISNFKLAEEGFYYFSVDYLKGLHDIIMMVNLFKTDHLSSLVKIDTDIEEIHTRLKYSDLRIKYYFQVIKDDSPGNSLITSNILEYAKDNEIELIAQNPVYYLKKGEEDVAEFMLKMGGILQEGKKDKNQYLGSLEDLAHFFPKGSIENKQKIIKECNFLISKLPIRYPDFELKTKIDYSFNETLKDMVWQRLEFTKNEEDREKLKDIIFAELAYIRKFNIADYIIFLKEFKEEYKQKFNGGIFFTGFVSDLFIAHALGLTWSSPLYITQAYHRSMLKSKKLHPVINIIIASDKRDEFIEYVSGKFGKDKVCYLSEYVRWHSLSLINTLVKEFKVDNSSKDVFIKHLSTLSKYGSIKDIMAQEDVKKLLVRHPEYKDIFAKAVKTDGCFKNYSTNSSQIVIGSKPIKELLPVSKTSNLESGVLRSFYDINTAKYFGVWNINIESHTYLSILAEATSLIESDKTKINELAKKLTERIKNEDTDLIPFFSYDVNRVRYLDFTKNYLLNLALYFEAGRSKLDIIFKDEKETPPLKKFENDLKITGGYVVFREQLFYVCEKLFPSQEFLSLKHGIYNSSIYNQFQFILDRHHDDKKNAQKITWLKKKVINSVFYASLSEISLKIFTSLKILDLKLSKPKKFYEIFFVKEVEKEGNWRKLLIDILQIGYKISKYNSQTIVKNIQLDKQNLEFKLPLYTVKGISHKVSDVLYEYFSSSGFLNFKGFLETIDKEVIKHNIVSLLIKVGFFDDYDSNRKQLLQINDIYFRELKNEAVQDELFSEGYVELQDDEVDDYSIFEKIELEKELVGFAISELSHTKEEFLSYIKFENNILISNILKFDAVRKEIYFFKDNQPIALNFNDEFILEESAFYKVWYSEENDITRYEVLENIYKDSAYVLYVSIPSTNKDILTGLLEMTRDEGNCEIEILFSDSFEIVKPGKSILLTKTNFEKIKKLLKDLPFYFQPKE
ncbi:MAG: PHP domain-containing protein [Candidatus Delongbacteria bacterium]|nr:PHP domain-containing protein [Candidatus Delongbacteria bacterium]